MNIALNSLFYNIGWLPKINKILCNITDLFEVFRGMKTGQDEIYYLQKASDVDAEYVGRILRSAKTCEYLTAKPDTYSFICDKSIEELNKLGHTKTFEWINKFKDHINQSVPNKTTFWKNLGNGSFSGSDKIRLFTGMNPERRIFYGLLEEPAQINQRAIGFKPLSDDVNIELCHVLLNSVLGIFYTEATGFPKGLGALDNCAENVKKIKMLNPKLLSQKQINTIIETFMPLLNRKIMTTFQEFEQPDRMLFEKTVAECFGYSDYFEYIKSSVFEMQRVRLSVKK